jgi:hypothetical protein
MEDEYSWEALDQAILPQVVSEHKCDNKASKSFPNKKLTTNSFQKVRMIACEVK